LCFHPSRGVADDPAGSQEMIVRPELFSALTEPPCSYCSTQQLKGLIRPDDRVIAWVRGAHNGGAFPLRHFLAGPRVVNDTYGLFFYDPDGGYVAAYRKDYGYRFHGWRNGIMVVQGPDGSLWSALSGRCFAGPQQGNSLHRVPAIVTNWQYWLMLHPESTAYDLFDGQTYQVTELPTERTAESKTTMGQVDERLNPDAQMLGVHVDSGATAFVLDELPGRACFNADVGGQPVTVFWYARTGTAVAFHRELDGRTLTFYADNISPETAPIKDRETGTRWTLAGRGIDGPLRGRELKWVDSLQCRWFAWSSEYRNSNIHESREVQTSKQK
ncbi:MAG: DUF3179 domain-containing protein, partial [Planctomycetaceae bacterium]|nr:DUF3179 domain-containing protein [Planctomycetaceae bacterium]